MTTEEWNEIYPIVSTEQKNIAIAEMLGWEKLTKEQEESWANCSGDRLEKLKVKNIVPILRSISRNEYIFGDDTRFHSDANWQFEAIEWVEKQDVIDAEYASNYNVDSNCFGCSIETTGYHSYTVINVDNQDRKEAIFEALYQFSQYIKQK